MYKFVIVLLLTLWSTLPGCLFAQAETNNSGMSKTDIFIHQTSCLELQKSLRTYDEFGSDGRDNAAIYQYLAKKVREAIRKLKDTNPVMWEEKKPALTHDGKCV